MSKYVINKYEETEDQADKLEQDRICRETKRLKKRNKKNYQYTTVAS